MRWTKVAMLVLLLFIVVPGIAYVYPLFEPLIHYGRLQGIGPILAADLLSPHPQTGLGKYYVYVLLISGGLILLVAIYDLKMRRSTVHGSAHHASRRETHKYLAPRLPSRALQLFGGEQEHRLLLGKYRGRVVSLDAQMQCQHVLLTAPTGAGKSTRFFIPNLLREVGGRSLIIADLKGELYKVCAGWLAQYMQVWLFAPAQSTSQGYNPLAHIKSVEQAQDFAETWVANTGQAKNDDFWASNARLLITAMTLHLLATEREPAFARLADLLTTSSFDELRVILGATRSQDARRLAHQFLENMAENERLVGSVLTDIGNRFQLLASPQARAVTARNDINFQEMIETKTAFFLSISRSDTRRYRPLLAVLTQQMFSTWERHGTNGVGCYLDEFTNLGYIPGYADFISTARALKVSLLMAVQSFSQLEERYGKNDAETIKSNAVTHLLLPGAGLQETRYYSERIGDTTIRTESVTKRGNGFAGEVSGTESEVRRRLMTADELRTMRPDRMLMIEATTAPLLLQTTPYFRDPQLAKRANLLCATTVIRQEPAEAVGLAPVSRGLPPSHKTRETVPPTIVDANHDEDDAQFFQQE